MQKGFFGKSFSQYDPANPSWGVHTGCDQIRLHRLTAIDYVSHHLWPDDWFGDGCGWVCKVNFMREWMEAQFQAAASQIGKPVHLGEYKCEKVIVLHFRGKEEGSDLGLNLFSSPRGSSSKLSRHGNRLDYLQTLLEEQQRNARDGGPSQGGDAIWYWGDESVISNDEYAIYPADTAEVSRLSQHARRMGS